MSKYIYTNSEHCPRYLTPGKLYEYDNNRREIIDDDGDGLTISISGCAHLKDDPFYVLPDFYDTEYSGNIADGKYKLYGLK